MTREQLTPFLTLDQKNVVGYYLKIGCEDFYLRQPQKEFEGYKLLRPYFRMPKARLAQTSVGPILVVQAIKDASAASKLLETDPQAANRTLVEFMSDMEKMWLDTRRPMDEEQVARNWRLESLKTLVRLASDPTIESIGDKAVIVNGEKYPPVGQTLEECLNNLSRKKDPIMVLCHGDEHLENLLTAHDGYYVIDPGNYTGLNSPSSTVNNVVGANYLFLYQYNGTACSENGNFRVDYRVKEPYENAEKLMKPTLRRLDVLARDILCGDSLDKELLFANEIRVAVGWVHRSMDLTEIRKTGMVYAGIATEHYYSDGII
ncbi:hypothetical protein A2962_04990 [Candidatus Woesebacteria bacterium RIFCSPLOWO2_01_FULL_39_61]|uniref:Aminoglycoside phosphotransferase domain-containing protein n=1 Tax=Candidatus Woesebacteria bacterium RIFCSPHIGHO2_02_FULL_39_13 TaxID=1802505 RepID=A0A1F7YZL0_9BACT|nr:MAG: hypothetical protein A2692_03240 [Candidatus Woesebacteria bacterium RIFCSPHIGHO2_01_FULL_39_95]OGM32624.1 MAG: hypothetical protein A3D01_05215 [Candidatus Woesebacteria bacterium RIFCSPHIGHO2_02_FULL_39_13]OGM36421.1 MAG: hypothetical protein A3E13_00760 [Candidatus Woesebacteria bacterium RIFCSPHIGHO2_12_FULL_40_20]OGM66692.1 MAG: hypothetical protein A2962_04990 [Candidatus Woesebacteria bacterium RIFCSPLOWO2_01_FULL_39_61]OGM73026.1 MAG: hypothetical protein A3H19_03125 [Candidatus